MSVANYKIEEIEALEDDYLYRKIDEHYRIDRLVRANSDLLSYEIKRNDPQYPHPPTHYLITYTLKSFTGINEDKLPVIGNQHELSIEVPRYFPEQSAECKMLSPTWHPNIKSSGIFEGDICTNHKGFGGLYQLDELIVRIGEFLQYKRYLAEDRKPWPEDPKVARWVRNFAEPQGIVNKEEGNFVDDNPWNVFLDDVDLYTADDEIIDFVEKEYTEDSSDTVTDADTDKPEHESDDADDEITISDA